MERVEFFKLWSEHHGGAKITGIVKWWLSISFKIATILTRLKVSPNILTSLGIVLAAALYLTLEFNVGLTDRSEEIKLGSLFLALLLLILSLMADGIDGSVAIVSGKVSKFGAAWDAIADRISESLWALAFITVGADYRIIAIAWLASQIQEYIRARSAGLGEGSIGIVTICERPVRASLLAIALVLQVVLLLTEELLDISSIPWINIIAMIWLLMQFISLAMLATSVTSRLKVGDGK